MDKKNVDHSRANYTLHSLIGIGQNIMPCYFCYVIHRFPCEYSGLIIDHPKKE